MYYRACIVNCIVISVIGIVNYIGGGIVISIVGVVNYISGGIIISVNYIINYINRGIISISIIYNKDIASRLGIAGKNSAAYSYKYQSLANRTAERSLSARLD